MTRAVVPCSVVIPTYRHAQRTIDTLERIQNCDPAPAEIIIHVDANEQDCAAAIHNSCPNVRIISSEKRLGPGGGRNKLVATACYPIVASFDDDSYPIDRDYFARLVQLFESVPEASVVAAAIYHRGDTIGPPVAQAQSTADFVGCGCAYRRERFLDAGGYVPLPIAYGMEEADLALRIHAAGGQIIYARWLRVFHDTDRNEQASAAITSASIANLALLAFLRYPISLLPTGACQVANRVLWLIRHKRYKGIGHGLMRIPGHLAQHLKYRKPQSLAAIRSYRRLRRMPREVLVDAQSPSENISSLLARNNHPQ